MDATALRPIKCPVSAHTLFELEGGDRVALSPPVQIICRCGLRLRILAVNHITILGGSKAPAIRVQ
jgi:hypothetical protein